MTASRVKGNEKNARSVRRSWFDGVCLTAHVLQREQEELCVPSVLHCVVEAFLGGYADSDDVEGAQQSVAFQRRLPDCSRRAALKTALRTRVRHRMVCALCLSAFAVSRQFVACPLVGFQVQWHRGRGLQRACSASTDAHAATSSRS